ncbi:MAG: hypothetical protein KAG97_13510, partial [Victivallales bacterium]|nr:hypothetical protein [Victivallales bacterium]
TKLRKTLERMKYELDSELKLDEDQVLETSFKAMKSMRNHWDGLIVFLDNPEIQMGNNRRKTASGHAPSVETTISTPARSRRGVM